MAFGKIESLMLATIFGCISYLYLAGNLSDTKLKRTVTEEELADLLAADRYPFGVHAVRSLSNSVGTTIIVVDLSFPEIYALTLDDADGILNAFHKVLYSSCNNTRCYSNVAHIFQRCTCFGGGNVYRWTLIVDELDYVKTRLDDFHIPQKPTVPVLPILKKGVDESTIIAKVHILKGSDVMISTCVTETVSTALEYVLFNKFNNYTK